MYPLTGAIRIKIQEKDYSESITGSIKNNYQQAYEKERQNCLFDKRETSYNKQRRRERKHFRKKSNGKAGIPPSINEEVVRKVLQ